MKQIIFYLLNMMLIFLSKSEPQYVDDSKLLTAEEVETLTFSAFQLYKCCPDSYNKIKDILESNFKKEGISCFKNLFDQQNGIYPQDGEYQLENFGIKIEDYDQIEKDMKINNFKLLIMIRHGQAWENLNPTGNENCEFELKGVKIQNFDSPLTPLGHDQTKYLNSNENFKKLLVKFKINEIITSPLMRTMQTSENIFKNFKSSLNIRVIPEEMIRASLGKDVCNARKNVKGNILKNEPPFETNCNREDVSLMEIFEEFKELSFKIRPIGSSKGFGLIGDQDELWRSDLNEPDELLALRAKAFITKLKSNKIIEPKAYVMVTHGEMIDMIYKILGNEDGYHAKNSQVVPILIYFPKKK